MSGKLKWGNSGSGSSVHWGSINSYTSDDGKYAGKYTGGTSKTYKPHSKYSGMLGVHIPKTSTNNRNSCNSSETKNDDHVHTVDSEAFYKVVKKKGTRKKGNHRNKTTEAHLKTPYLVKIIGSSNIFKEIVNEITSEGAYLLDIPEVRTEVDLPLNCPVFFQANNAGRNDLYKFSSTICTIKYNHMRILLGEPQRFNNNSPFLQNYKSIHSENDASLIIEIHKWIKK